MADPPLVRAPDLRYARDVRTLAAAVLLVGACVLTHGQTAAIMATAADERPLTVGTAAALVGSATDTLSDTVAPQEAPAQLAAMGFAVPEDPTAPISVGAFARILVQLLDVPTGLMYSLFPSAHFAFRELVAQGAMPEDWRMGAYLGGVDALRTLGMAMDLEPTRPEEERGPPASAHPCLPPDCCWQLVRRGPSRR